MAAFSWANVKNHKMKFIYNVGSYYNFHFFKKSRMTYNHRYSGCGLHTQATAISI